MIHSYPETETPWSEEPSAWSGAVWLDLIDASDEERKAVQAATGLRVPDQADVREIETTSRVYTENGALYLSTPLPASGNASEPLTAVAAAIPKIGRHVFELAQLCVRNNQRVEGCKIQVPVAIDFFGRKIVLQPV